MAVPAVTPVTVPPITVAEALLLLQVPPVVVLDNTVVAPTQTVDEPVMTPALVAAPMVIVLVVVAVPQISVTV